MFVDCMRWYRAALAAMLARGRGLAENRAALDEARENLLNGPHPGLDRLVAEFALTATDVDFLWAVIGSSLDATTMLQQVQLHGEASRRGIDLGTVAALIGLTDDESWQLALRLGPEHPLLRAALIEVDVPFGPLAARRFIAPRRTIGFLAGMPVIDEALSLCGGQLTAPSDPLLAPEQERALRQLAAALADREPVFIILEGAAATGKRAAVALAAATTSRPAVEIDLRRFEGTAEAMAAGLRSLSREHALVNALPVLSSLGELGGNANDPRRHELLRFLDGIASTVIGVTEQAGITLPVAKRVVRITWPTPDARSRRDMWPRVLPATSAVTAAQLDELAYRYDLGAGAIRRAGATAVTVAHGADRDHVVAADVVEAIRSDTAERLQSLAMRVSVHQSWNDLVAADDTMEQIRAFTDRVRHGHQVFERWGFRAKVGRSTGAAALFSGPPGTGKTMVAGLIARELGLDLYQVDLSKVVSKWVGETEKQLGALFDAAAAGHVMLLFDEADALFAKRSTDVKSATDRYANLEVNYLLQRIEAFGGVSILTTNLDANLDEALRRRLCAHVVFGAPDDDERTTLWNKFLDGAPRADNVDIARLVAEYPDLSGAHIRNAVVAAAFSAAATRTAANAIDHGMLDRAALAEYAGLGKVLGGKRR